MRYAQDFTTQVNSGTPDPDDAYPFDLYPSGTPRRYHQENMYSQTLAGIGATSAEHHTKYATLADQGRALGMQDYPRELQQLSEMDDVQGNGIFDPYGAQGNLNQTEGVFADAASLPGYVAREKFFAPSEVLDATTGKPVVYIPGVAFMLDARTPDALREMALYEPSWPGTENARNVRGTPIFTPNEPAWGVGAEDGAPPSSGMMLFWGVVGGAAIGLVAGLMARKDK